jgi:DNA-directed RNA polymerase subunit alpha
VSDKNAAQKRAAILLASQGIRESLFSVPIEELELSARSHNCLKSADIHTVGELSQLKRDDLNTLPNFGKKSLDEVTKVMAWRGLFLSHNE